MSRVKFTVEPSEGCHDVLTIQDAFQQALDFFDLLTDEMDRNVVWKLEMASTNSPFTCEGEPVDRRTWAGAHHAVRKRVEIVERNFDRISRGLDFDESFPRSKVDTARKMLRRNTNGIGLTRAQFSPDRLMKNISQYDARRYFDEVEEPIKSLHSYLFSRTSRKEQGSIEGRIIDIGTDYQFPATHLEEHRTGRTVWCRISTASSESLAEQIKAGDAWNHKRVRVRGTLNYDAQGRPIRIVDGTVVFIDVPEPDLAQIQDTRFTEGYNVREYLDRLQENEFGN